MDSFYGCNLGFTDSYNVMETVTNAVDDNFTPRSFPHPCSDASAGSKTYKPPQCHHITANTSSYNVHREVPTDGLPGYRFDYLLAKIHLQSLCRQFPGPEVTGKNLGPYKTSQAPVFHLPPPKPPNSYS